MSTRHARQYRWSSVIAAVLWLAGASCDEGSRECIGCDAVAEAVNRDEEFCFEGRVELLHAELTLCDGQIHTGLDSASVVTIGLGEELYPLVKRVCGAETRIRRILGTKGVTLKAHFGQRTRKRAKFPVIRRDPAPEIRYEDVLMRLEKAGHEKMVTVSQLRGGSCDAETQTNEELREWVD